MIPSSLNSSMRALFGVFKLKNIVHQAQTSIAQRQSFSGQEQITNLDIIIAVIGAHGSGKSSIISDLTGISDGAIRHDLQSFSDSGIKIVVFEGLERSDQRIVFIDTPGIDHKVKSEEDVLKKIGGFLPKTCTLAAILYLQKISENRIPTKYLANIQLYKTLCGTEDLRKVHLVTTMWNEVDEYTGLEREAELTKERGPWRATIDQNANVHRYVCTAASAWAIVRGCIEVSNRQFDNNVGYDLSDLGGKILGHHAKASRGDYEQLRSLCQVRKTLLDSIRSAVIRGEADEQWAHLRSQLDALHVQICELGSRLKRPPLHLSSFGSHLHRITSGSPVWGT